MYFTLLLHLLLVKPSCLFCAQRLQVKVPQWVFRHFEYVKQVFILRDFEMSLDPFLVFPTTTGHGRTRWQTDFFFRGSVDYINMGGGEVR